MTLTLSQDKVFVNSKEVQDPQLFWKPCDKLHDKATLLCLLNDQVYTKEVSWLLHPLYKEGDDDATCDAVNSLFLPVVKKHKAHCPNLMLRHGAEEMYVHENLLVDFERGAIHTKPLHALLQRTGSTATFDACFFWGPTHLELQHIERKFLKPLIEWLQKTNCPVLDTGTDPISVHMIRDALQDLPLEEVIELIAGPASDSEDSEYIPSDDEIEYERPTNKRKRS